ncbi:MAG: hypothetical protein IKF90_10055 [Parasporobacterium sp.]|nr:hypothetical protein [Parasporobacterium sp.]
MHGMIKAATLKIRGGVERDSYGKKAGKGALIQWEKSATLGVSQDQTLFVWKETEAERLIGAMDGNAQR